MLLTLKQTKKLRTCLLNKDSAEVQPGSFSKRSVKVENPKQSTTPQLTKGDNGWNYLSNRDTDRSGQKTLVQWWAYWGYCWGLGEQSNIEN